MMTLATCMFLGLTTQAQTTKIDAVLEKLNSFNRSLQTLKANVSQRKYIKLLGEFEEPEKGYFLFKKKGKGFILKREITYPGQTILSINGQDFILYYPKKNQAVRRKLDEQQAGAVSFIFGMNPAGLKKDFDVHYIQDEMFQGSLHHVIELIPKNQKLRDQIKSLRLWIDSKTAFPTQQRIEELNGDYTVSQFSAIEINKGIDSKDLEMKLPKNVEFIS